MRAPGIRLLLVLLFSQSVSAETLDLYTFQAPPYQVVETEAGHSIGVNGTTVNTLRCITDQIGWQTQIHVVPQNRGIQAFARNFVDGYFPVGESSALDVFGTSTAPIALEKWYFFSRNPVSDFHTARLSVIAGSNEAAWLRRHDYPVLIEATSTEQLLALLDRARVDAIVADWHVMATYLNQAGTDPGASSAQFQSTFIRFAPLRLYLSQRFTADHPAFLVQFNHHLAGCVSTDFELSEAERSAIAELARQLFDSLQSGTDIATIITDGKRAASLAETLNLDRQWQALAPYSPSELADQLLSLPISRQLAQWQVTAAGLVSEVFLMDDTGAIIGLSQLTSDYWQGDEAKFQNLVNQPPDRLEISPMYFDDSSKRFQITVSRAVNASANGNFIGAIAIGLDVEKALQAAKNQQLLP